MLAIGRLLPVALRSSRRFADVATIHIQLNVVALRLSGTPQPAVADLAGLGQRRPGRLALRRAPAAPFSARHRLVGCAGACERTGSLDSAIRAPAANDFARLRERCPLLATVGFNGQTAGKFAPQFADAGYRTVLLPSTSPAYAAMPFAQKLLAWQRLLVD